MRRHSGAHQIVLAVTAALAMGRAAGQEPKGLAGGGVPGDSAVAGGGVPGSPAVAGGGVPGSPALAGGGVPGAPEVAGGGVPGRPTVTDIRAAVTLIAPTAGAEIRSSAAGTASVEFSWRPARTPARYRLCITPQGESCASRAAVVYDAGSATRYAASLPARLHGLKLEWRVAVCEDAPSGARETSDGACVFSAPRALVVASAAVEPSAIEPDDAVGPCF